MRRWQRAIIRQIELDAIGVKDWSGLQVSLPTDEEDCKVKGFWRYVQLQLWTDEGGISMAVK